MYAGMRIITDIHLVDITEDWSRVRSPSRAERRRRQGHRQNIIMRAVPKPHIYKVGDTLVMHPDIAIKLQQQTKEQQR